MCTGHTAALVGGIHHVVVVERAEVGHLERGRSEDDVLVRAVAELSGDQREHRADALAARLVQVPARRVGDLVGHVQLVGQHAIDLEEAVGDGGFELAGPGPRECAVGEAQLARNPRARR